MFLSVFMYVMLTLAMYLSRHPKCLFIKRPHIFNFKKDRAVSIYVLVLVCCYLDLYLW